MAISDEMFIIGIALIFVYMTIYKKSKILGGMIFIALSTGTIYYGSTATIDLAGMLMLIGSLGLIINDILEFKIRPKKKK